MKVGMLDPEGVAVREAKEPTLAGGDLLVKLGACGLCGSDIEKIHGKYGATGRIGHEPAGTVSQVAPDVPGFAPGDRVFVHHHVPCYNCAVCRKGAYTFCESYQKTNLDPGGFAEVFRAPRENVSRGAVLSLPSQVSFEEATMIEPLGCCLDTLRATPFEAGDKALVLGLGPIGLLYLRLLRLAGAGSLVGADVSSFRRQVAERSGADSTYDPLHPPSHPENDFDLVVVATSAVRAVADGIDRTRRGGTLNLFGLPEKGAQLPTDLQALYLRGVRIVPTYATTEYGTRRALDLIASGRLPVRDLLTHRFPLRDLPLAVQQAAKVEETIKLVVTP